MLNFKNIEPSDKELLEKYLKKADDSSCENSFANMIVWQKAYGNMYAVDGDILILKSCFDGQNVFRLPFGNDFDKGIELIREYEGSKYPHFWVQDGSALNLFKEKYAADYIIEEDRNSFDYIYLREDLANLSGKKYHSKRNHINSFSKKHIWHYEPIDKTNIEKVKKCAQRWYFENNDRLDIYMKSEKSGFDYLIDNAEALGISGGAIIVENEVVAFTLGSQINKDYFDIFIEKALKDYDEAYTVINNQFAKNSLTNYAYINREDDLGIEGLRKAKLSYKPIKLIKKYYCYSEKDDERKKQLH